MMRKKSYILIFIMCLFFSHIPCNYIIAKEKSPQKIIDLANNTFVKWGTDPVIVNAVKEENAKKKTLDKIKETDNTWQNTAGISPFMKQLIDSPCGKHILKLQKSMPSIAEIFVMDNQGANVAMTDKTSDYWQGDEDKFIKCYNQGKGSVFIGDIKFDDSSQAYLVQVSVPVKDGSKVVGTMTIGVDVDQVE